MKYLVLVNSATNLLNDKVNGNYPRSIYSTEERFQQTIETLKNVKRNIPNCHLILAEGTKLNNEQLKTFTSLCDELILLDEEYNIKNAVESKNKSLGEMTTLYFAVEYIINHKIEYDMMIKICSRNLLNSKFDLKIFENKDKFYMRCFSNNFNQWYSSGMYCIGFNCLPIFKNILEQSIESIKQNKIDNAESNLYFFIPKDKVILVDEIGISGTGGGCGTVFNH